MCVCALLYLVFPVILKLFKKTDQAVPEKKRRILLAVGSIAIFFVLEIAISYIAFKIGNADRSAFLSMRWITYLFPIPRLIEFLIGCCLGYIYLNRKEAEQKGLIKWTAMEVGAVLLIALSLYVYIAQVTFLSSESVRYSALFLPTTALIIWLTANSRGWISRILEQRLLVEIGNISSYAFLIHHLALKFFDLILSYAFSLHSPWLVFILSVIATFAAAYLWRWLETKWSRKRAVKN